MTDYREQAIRDVAAATLSGRGCRCRESLLHDYAVAQRERVLEHIDHERLQQNLVLLVRRLCHRVRTLTTIVGKNNMSAVAGDQLAKDAEQFLANHGLNGSILRSDPEAQLQQKEGERG